MVGDGHLALSQTLEERRLSRSVRSDQTISSADGELDGGVLDELLSVASESETTDLDIQSAGLRLKSTGGSACAQ